MLDLESAPFVIRDVLAAGATNIIHGAMIAWLLLGTALFCWHMLRRTDTILAAGLVIILVCICTTYCLPAVALLLRLTGWLSSLPPSGANWFASSSSALAVQLPRVLYSTRNTPISTARSTAPWSSARPATKASEDAKPARLKPRDITIGIPTVDLEIPQQTTTCSTINPDDLQRLVDDANNELQRLDVVFELPELRIATSRFSTKCSSFIRSNSFALHQGRVRFEPEHCHTQAESLHKMLQHLLNQASSAQRPSRQTVATEDETPSIETERPDEENLKREEEFLGNVDAQIETLFGILEWKFDKGIESSTATE